MLSSSSTKANPRSYTTSSVSAGNSGAGLQAGAGNMICFYGGLIYRSFNSQGGTIYSINPTTGTGSNVGYVNAYVSSICAMKDGVIVTGNTTNGNVYALGTSYYPSYTSIISSGYIGPLASDPTGTTLYARMIDGTIRSWSYSNGTFTQTAYATANLQIAALNAISSFPKAMAVGADGTVYLACLYAFSGSAPVYLATISPNGSTITTRAASFSEDNADTCSIAIDTDGQPILLGLFTRQLHKFPVGSGTSYRIVPEYTAGPYPTLTILPGSRTIYVNDYTGGVNGLLTTIAPNY